MASTSPSDFVYASTIRYPGEHMPQTFNNLLGSNTLGYDWTTAIHSPKQSGGGTQSPGWQSPTTYQYNSHPQDPAAEMRLLTDFVADDIPAEQHSAAENAALKAELHKLETAKTPSPRRTNSSRAFDDDTSPPNRPQQGPIEGMWGAGVSHEQRAMIAQASSPAASTPSPAKKRKTMKKDPKSVARKDATPKKTPAKKAAKKTNRRSKSSSSIGAFTTINGQVTLSPEALAQPIRPATQLLDLPWEELTHIEKATLLLPMLQDFQPETRVQLDSPALLESQASYEQGNYNDNAAEQVSWFINQDEECRYIEDVADPAYFNYAHDSNNVDGAEDQDVKIQGPATQAFFGNYEYFNDNENTKHDECIELRAEQDAIFNDVAALQQNERVVLPYGCSFGEPQADNYLSTAEPISGYTDLTNTSITMPQGYVDAQMLATFGNNTKNQASVDFFANFMVAGEPIADYFHDLPAVKQSSIDMSNHLFGGLNGNGISCASSDNSFIDGLNLEGMTSNGDGTGFTASDKFNDLASVDSSLYMSQYTTEPAPFDPDADFQAGMVRQRAALERYENTRGRRR